MEVELYFDNIDYDIDLVKYNSVIQKICKELKLNIVSCNVVFVNDTKLSEMHEVYLNDPSPTDVITFNLGEEQIDGELYISLERAIDHAQKYKVTIEEEILRLIVHGILHLAGYEDLDDKNRVIMKQKEDKIVKHYYDFVRLIN